ncbi:GGDEF domain-containing protein [Aureimonas altamirensis]|uniref:GGDEF domain-containing protein n=1 Tax=Aureimonas altamirensis TaxID=370622 RepID=UPI001E636CCB|nr:GGDEF domain-containing protein [Aureimonas altamirensis]UHD43895.1 GGDEF domain-containing protein [Aureimonas altamirensis]
MDIPKLDFLTLYVMISVIGVALTAIWGAVYWQHPSFRAARTWFAACLASSLGGLLLPFQYGLIAPLIAAFAFGLVTLSFWLFWSGVRQFYGFAPRLRIAGAVACVSALIAVATFSHAEFAALLYASGQGAPLIALMVVLLWRRPQSVGVAICCVGLCIGITSQLIVAGMNLVILLDNEPTPDWSAAAALTMVGGILCGLLLNFGLAVMTIDHLRAELIELADTESLSGLYNRRGFESSAKNALAQATGRSTLVLCDLDHFKNVNDQFGHTAGDAVLRQFGLILETTVRAGDICGRVGGEEFAILLPDTSVAVSYAVVEQIRSRLGSSEFKANGRAFHVTASFGMCEQRRRESWSGLYARADQLLYAAKDEGRDKVISG